MKLFKILSFGILPGVQSLPSSFFSSFFPAYNLTRSPPSELRALLSQCLEEATFGSNFSAKSILQRVIKQRMELFIVVFRSLVHVVWSNGTPHDFMTVSWTSDWMLEVTSTILAGRLPTHPSPNSMFNATLSLYSRTSRKRPLSFKRDV